MGDLVPCLQAGSRFGKFCFSHDSRYLFCCCGSVVKVYNTTNGECVHDLKAHVKAVTGVFVNPKNVLQVLTCSVDGRLIFWDYLDGVKLKEHDLKMALYGIISVNPETKSVMIVTDTASQKSGRGKSSPSLILWKRNKSNPNEFCQSKTLIERCSSDTGLISFGCLREFVASGCGHILTIYSLKEDKSITVHDTDKYNQHRPITCVACHPTDYVIAAGLSNGKIILWHNFFNNNQPVISRIHWHALPVLCLAFTPDGSNLLSGGHECVLVKWQTAQTDKRDFKPRMGAPLTQVLCAPDGAFYATLHSDNVVQLLNIGLSVLQVYRGMTRGNMGLANRNPIPSGLRYDPRSQALVTNGVPGHLQFYSLALNKQLFNLDIVGQNYISPENTDRPKVITEVTASAISDNGEWLATFETWDDGHFTPEQRLKFWAWSSEAQTYSLNTTVEFPHDGYVTSMVFQPNDPSLSSLSEHTWSLVTVGSDCCFKLWTLIDDTDIYRKNMRWDCSSVGFYRGLRASCADFSEDGTALAVAFEHLVTLWDPDNNVVQATMANPHPDKQAINHIYFGKKQSSHHLVGATSRTLLVWDLLTLSVVWKVEDDINVLFSDPASDLMAVVTAQSTLNVFSPSSSTIVYQHPNVSCGNKATTSSIVDAVFIPNGRHRGINNVGWEGTSQIYMFSADEELITLDLPSQQTDGSSQVKVAQNLAPSAMSAFLAEKVVREQGSVEKIPLTKRQKPDEEYMNALLHSNEPVSMQCDQYLRTLLVKGSQFPVSVSSPGSDSSSEDDVSEPEMDTDDDDISLPLKKTSPLPDVVPGREKEEDMDRLLSASSDWIQWCQELTLK